MSVRTKLAAFALVLLGAFGAGAVVGTAVGPIDVGDQPAPMAPAPPDHQTGGHG